MFNGQGYCVQPHANAVLTNHSFTTHSQTHAHAHTHTHRAADSRSVGFGGCHKSGIGVVGGAVAMPAERLVTPNRFQLFQKDESSRAH